MPSLPSAKFSESICLVPLFIVAPIVCGGCVFSPCYAILSVISSFAIIVMRKRGMAVFKLLYVSS